MAEDFMALSQDEFIQRFTAELVRIVGPTYQGEDEDEPGNTAMYAAEVAPSYFDDPWQREDGPEACAQADYSYWGD